MKSHPMLNANWTTPPADPVIEFVDEIPNLIPAIRICVIGMGSRNDVRRAVLKRQAAHGKGHVPRF
jgi:hypothetical protein